uniref:Zinc finger, CCHC-type n=1 Tax=Tanacetum cinerariifolium TaxID=118510 RepID=A0A6L2M1I7_TANCI|nr:zinc finger, CCHC-type [Tanacetum cinerariifolium]
MLELFKDATVEAIQIRAKWENDDYICMGHILNGMSDSLSDVYTNVESAKELWDSLESKYMAKDSSSKKFLKDFKHTLKHGKDDLSLVQLDSHLRIEETLRAQDSDKGKGKEVDAIAWWIDSGATTHVCKDRCWFKTYEPVYESDKYILSKSGAFVGFGYYNNGMFMLNLNKVPDDSDSVYISSFTVVNSSLWHARLGHVHYKRMLKMSKDDLIPTIDENPEKCTTSPYTPQQNGVAERKNRALKEMVNSMLSYSGLSEGFWGKAMLTACYLLNRVHNKRNKTTPYKLWYKKRPNLAFLRVWGCRAVVRLPDPKWKTVGEKCIDCIFVRYAEHSKEYRFYIIELNDSVSINSIIKSRDAIFDENRFSSIPRPKDIIPNSDKSQRDDHSNDVPNEIPKPRKVDKTKKFLSPRFSMKDMEETDVILGIKIKRENKRIVITQFHYIEKILKKFNHEDCSPLSTPMDPVEKLKLNTGKPVDQLEYSRAIGCLIAPTMARAYSQIYNGKSRHLGVRHSMVRELIRNGVISIEFVRTQHNLVDHLTKSLARDLVYKSVIMMGLKSI